MKRVWLLGIIYIIVLICFSLLLVTLSSGVHKPFLSKNAQLIDKDVTTFLKTGEPLSIQKFTPKERSHLADVRKLISITFFIVITTIIVILLFWFTLSYPEQQGVLLSPLLFLFYFTPPFLIGNFSKSFIVFHQIFFPQGNYSFPFDSLLIKTYPERFFFIMTILILIFILICSILKLLGWNHFGRKLFSKN